MGLRGNVYECVCVPVCVGCVNVCARVNICLCAHVSLCECGSVCTCIRVYVPVCLWAIPEPCAGLTEATVCTQKAWAWGRVKLSGLAGPDCTNGETEAWSEAGPYSQSHPISQWHSGTQAQAWLISSLPLPAHLCSQQWQTECAEQAPLM